jgi:hypothetical protein
MLGYLNKNPTTYLDELALVLFDEFDIELGPQTVWDYLVKRNRWSRKKAKRDQRVASLPLRALWCEKRMDWLQDRLVFCDESASDLRTGRRKTVWSPIGTSSFDLIKVGRSARYSVLPLLSVNGYIDEATLIVKGSVHKNLFLHWLQHTVLPLLEPGFHILVMDNASTYYGPEI